MVGKKEFWGRKNVDGFMEEEENSNRFFSGGGILRRKIISKQKGTLSPRRISTQNSPRTGIEVENAQFQA